MGAHAALHGTTMRTWTSSNGVTDAATVAGLITPNAGPYLVSTAAVALENTHNFGGGTVQPYSHLVEVSQLCRDAGVKLHLDGARLWNAHVATGVALVDYGRLFDTVNVCFSKGLGAPIGSLICGPADVMPEARRLKILFGGAWRQAGIVAAAGLLALEEGPRRLHEDHARARRLAAAIAEIVPGGLDPQGVETNMVFVDTEPAVMTPLEAVQRLEGEGVGATLVSGNVRMVTHVDIADEDVETAIAAWKVVVAG